MNSSRHRRYERHYRAGQQPTLVTGVSVFTNAPISSNPSCPSGRNDENSVQKCANAVALAVFDVQVAAVDADRVDRTQLLIACLSANRCM
ncbi:hypothetical protein [Arthrobacter sp. 2MCAF14]|uniref:hypothetical protein n=1 Tax=Arthrobacter sp. 2MCAF14 TaxID=3232982 RepID=UPI003F8D9A69